MTCSLLHWHEEKWVEGIGWVTCEGLSQLSFQIFQHLENGRAGWEVPQERQGDSGEEHLPESLVVIWWGPHGTPLRLVLTSRVLSYYQVPTAPLKSKQRKWKVPTPPRRVQGWQWFCGPLVLLPMCGAPYSVCSVAAVQVQVPTSRDIHLPTKRGRKAATGFYSLFQPNSHTWEPRHQ